MADPTSPAGQTRRLSAEMREEMKRRFINLNFPQPGEMLDALHDLDVLDGELITAKSQIRSAGLEIVGTIRERDQAYEDREQLISMLNQTRDDLAAAQAEALARTHEREHWHQRALEAEQKLQAMTESRDFWKQMVKDEVANRNGSMPVEGVDGPQRTAD